MQSTLLEDTNTATSIVASYGITDWNSELLTDGTIAIFTGCWAQWQRASEY